MSAKVRLVSDGVQDTYLELDGKRLDMPIMKAEFSHEGGMPPTFPNVTITLEGVEADVRGELIADITEDVSVQALSIVARLDEQGLIPLKEGHLLVDVARSIDKHLQL